MAGDEDFEDFIFEWIFKKDIDPEKEIRKSNKEALQSGVLVKED